MRGVVIVVACALVAAAGASAVAASRETGNAAPPVLGGCPVLPAGNVWNRDVSSLPVAAGSDATIAAIGLDAHLHPDFGSIYGIPFQVVHGKRLRAVHPRFEYADESDRVGYPMPAHPRIEGGGDRHVLIVDRDRCRLYELYAAERSGSSWHAGSGAVFDLRSNHLRPDGWTSADAAGLPILPGLARYAEAVGGGIHHALRFTASRTRDAHIYPARHDAGSSDPSLPPMGLRVRLKASASLAGLGPQARAVAQALKTYGMILADNGSPWYVTGAPDRRWSDDDLHALSRFSGADFEVVETSTLRNR